MKTLLIDNYDSFVYNLYQYLNELGCKVDVIRNDQKKIEDLAKEKYERIVISPGPGSPENKKDFGICGDVILELGIKTPLLGVCLGHQGIVSAFGGRIIRARKPMHGKQSTIMHNGKGIFSGIRNRIKVMRYHSLIAEENSLPAELEVTAKSADDNAIMAVQHRKYPVYGLQFHPESIMTEGGKKLLRNFLKIK